MPNETVVGTLELRATFENISVYAPFIGDDNHNNLASFQWRRPGGLWKQGMAMTVDTRAEVTSEDGTYPNPFQNQWRASILGYKGLGVRPNTDYEVRVTFDDPDGISGPTTIVSVIRTRDDNFRLGTGTKYYVALDGNDANPGTISQPFRTIQHAIDMSVAGDTIYVRAGVYLELLSIAASGTPNNWITIMNYCDEDVTLDGWGTVDNMSIGSGVSHVRIHGFNLVNTSDRSLTIHNNAHDIVIEASYFRSANRSMIRVGTIWDAATGIANITIQDCGFYADATNGGGPHFISFQNANGGGHVVRRNILIGSTTKPSSYIDGIGGYKGGIPEGFMFRNSDIYDNFFENIGDDAIECDGGNMNVRVYENTMKNCFDGISDCACILGPLYAYRNVYWVDQARPFACQTGVKLGHQGTGFSRLYHNTFWTEQATNCLKQTNAGLDNVISRNNIYRAGRHCIELHRGNLEGHGHDFDYDALFTSDPSRDIAYIGGNMDLEDIRGYGWEAHGLGIDATDEFVNAVNGDFRLKAGSLLSDKGEIIIGFNDPNSPWPYSGAAPDLGAIEGEGITPPPTADFEVDKYGGPAPLTVQFTDKSTGAIDLWIWDFGDGATSSKKSPSHTFQNKGTYDVLLTVSGPGGERSASVTIEVTGPVVSHSLTITTGPGGTTDPTPDIYEYIAGSEVEITALPVGGYRFVTWQIDTGLITNNPLNIPRDIEITADTTITALFERIPYQAGCFPAALVAAIILPILVAIAASRRAT